MSAPSQTALAPVPTLDEVAAHPEQAALLQRAAVLALHARAVRALAALEGPLLAQINESADRGCEPEARLLDARAVAQLLGVSKSWVDHHLAELPRPIRIGSRARWRQVDIERWLRTRP